MLSCSVVSDSLQPHGLVVGQAPLSMEFSRQEYWSGLPFSVPGHLSLPGIEPEAPASPALAGKFFTKVASQVVKNLPANAGNAGLILNPGRSPGGGNGNPLQYSCLGNPTDIEAWQAQSVVSQKSWTTLKDYTTRMKLKT